MKVEKIPGKKQAPLDLGHVLVLGLGKSGKAAFRYCYALLGQRVKSLSVATETVSDQEKQFLNQFDLSKVNTIFGTDEFTQTYDLCIASPGISQFSNFYQNASRASVELVSEVEFAWRESSDQSYWIAITGTNGKTTTTALTAHLLREAGKKAWAVGNIGDTCLEAVMKNDITHYVVETSSFQLASTHDFAPNIAIILNISPDHLSWHQSFENYLEAKKRILANMSSVEDACAVLEATDAEVRTIIKSIRSQKGVDQTFEYIPLGTAAGLEGDMRTACASKNAAFCQEGRFVLAYKESETSFGEVSDLKIKGDHNKSNALAASCAAFVSGISPSQITAALATFLPLEHRIEPCGSVSHIACFNDSKATNTDATIKALSAFPQTPPIMLLGGYDKGTDLHELVIEVEKSAKMVVCFGAAGTRFYEAFSHAEIPVFQAEKLEDAFDVALLYARTGDVVLLSPACASFDEFTSFEHRGEVFKELVNAKAKDRGA